MSSVVLQIDPSTATTANQTLIMNRIQNDPYYKNVTLLSIDYTSDAVETNIVFNFSTAITNSQYAGLNIFVKAIYEGVYSGTNYWFQNVIPETVRNTIHNNHIPSNITDLYSGYNIGSIVFNNYTNTIYTCVDPTPGNAVWVQSSSGIVCGVTGSVDPNTTRIYYSSLANNHFGYRNVNVLTDSNETASIGITAGTISIQGITQQNQGYQISYNPNNNLIGYVQPTLFSVNLIPTSVNITGSTYMILGGTLTSNNLGPVDISTYGYNAYNNFDSSAGNFNIGITGVYECNSNIQFQEKTSNPNYNITMRLMNVTNKSLVDSVNYNILNNGISNYNLNFLGNLYSGNHQFQISYNNPGTNAILTQIKLSCKNIN